jgi:hypothetical protein
MTFAIPLGFEPSAALQSPKLITAGTPAAGQDLLQLRLILQLVTLGRGVKADPATF